MTQTIAVTGSNGMIGTAVVKQLLNADFRVIAIVRTLPIDTPRTNLEYRLADMRDGNALTKALTGATTVIHLAARKSDEKDSQAINIDGAKNLVAACKANGIASIINISTQSVRLSKKGIYASTKAAADHIIMSSGIPTVTLLPSVVYSDDQSGIFQSLFAFTSLPIVPVIGNGEAAYHPIHVEDAAAVIVGCIEKPQIIGQSFDVGGREPWTFNQLVDAVLTLRGLQKHKLHLPIWLCILLAFVTRWMPKPPLTRSNVLGAAENVPMNPDPILQITGIEPRTLTQGLQDIGLMRKERAKRAEATVLLRYIGRSFDQAFEPSSLLIDRFLIALSAHKLETANPLDESFVQKPSRLSALDSWTRLRHPHCHFQQKILIAAALLECDPVSADWFLPTQKSIVQIISICINTTIKAIISTFIGFLRSLSPSFVRNAGL
ncbi:MAG: NAD(P)H-binding protein [Candidatus Peribacteraceae bacterium]|nr:NAD(P)H-binding protein [Candidatus Peribacteraceae bacterium]